MNTHPTIVHAAADFHRQALLREAVDDGKTKPPSVMMTSTGPGKACRRTITWLAKVVSQIIDDFEPGPGAPPRRTVGGIQEKPRSSRSSSVAEGNSGASVKLSFETGSWNMAAASSRGAKGRRP